MTENEKDRLNFVKQQHTLNPFKFKFYEVINEDAPPNNIRQGIISFWLTTTIENHIYAQQFKERFYFSPSDEDDFERRFLDKLQYLTRELDRRIIHGKLYDVLTKSEHKIQNMTITDEDPGRKRKPYFISEESWSIYEIQKVL